MAAVTVLSDFRNQENKIYHYFHFFPIYLPWSDRTGYPDLSFWMLSFKPAFSTSYFTFIKRLLSFSLLSAIRVVSSAYLQLLIFLPEILIPIWDLSSLAFYMMFSAYKLNKQGDTNFGPVCFSMSSSNCCFLTCIPISQEAGQVVWYSHLFKYAPQFVVIHAVKAFGVVNKAIGISIWHSQ